jgi:hypothetical protein
MLLIKEIMVLRQEKGVVFGMYVFDIVYTIPPLCHPEHREGPHPSLKKEGCPKGGVVAVILRNKGPFLPSPLFVIPPFLSS